MVSVSGISSHLIGGLTKSKPVKALCNYFQSQPENALAYTTLGSILLKDGIGCGMYVYQSLHNKDIPKERRGFVAALDLTNGGLMIASQALMFFAMRKANKKLFPLLFNSSFGKAPTKTFKEICEQVRIEMSKVGLVPSRKFRIKNQYDAIKSDVFSTFSTITELVAATIVGKRIVVPFIATPLAPLVQNWLVTKFGTAEDAAALKNNPKGKVTDKDTFTASPSMQGTGAVNVNGANLLDEYKNRRAA